MIKYTNEELIEIQKIKEKYNEYLKDRADNLNLYRIQLAAELELFEERCKKERFATISNDPEKILSDVRQQAPKIIEELYNSLVENGNATHQSLDDLVGLDIGLYKDDKFILNSNYVAKYLSDEFTLHIETLKDNTNKLHELFKIIITAIRKSPYTDNPVMKNANNPIEPIPNGESIAFLYKVLNMKGGRAALSPGKNRHNEIKSMANDSKTMLRYTSESKDKKTYIEVTITQADEYLRKSNKTTEKVLTYVLQSMNKQNYPHIVRIFLSDLVEDGLYSTKSNAKRGVLEFFEQQKCITLKGTVKKNNQVVKEKGGVLFYNYDYDPGKGTIDLQMNENFNIDFIANYFSVFPRFAYALKNNNAFSLVRYIFYIARQRTREINETGTFSINLDSVRENLGLPAVSEVKNRKYRQYIIDPIEKAIEEIEEALKNEPEAQDRQFTVTPIVPDTTNIEKWLTGYLEIGLTGEFAKSFIAIAKKAESDRKKWEKARLEQQVKLIAKTKKEE